LLTTLAAQTKRLGDYRAGSDAPKQALNG
jgi:hypothetical protein